MGPNEIPLQCPARWTGSHQLVVGYSAKPRAHAVADLAVHVQINAAGIGLGEAAPVEPTVDSPTKGFTAAL